ncbi:MAG: sulfite exporter TauE/SafE family protein [Nitrosopumilus sp.]|uniref:sulfite exporter TauE/SafE family protein n=1 Tax=Nitrosopumilus sp. TaxID=2024843 RepID=UPI00242FC14F|nr:sulfite exporter TauE/SafE family protein [Nitrosopumilus sp.]MCV0366786.1 sulfite exporter TauE/SafE family protein [Nitrosopumilus sp.]
MSFEFFLEPLTTLLIVSSGVLVGFSLGLIGGGGSVLAVPLLLYVVGIKDVHTSIGISSLAIGVIAAVHLLNHRKSGNLKIRKGLTFMFPGIFGTILGSTIGLWTSSENLLVLFAMFMILVGIFMLRKKETITIHANSTLKFDFLKRNLLVSGFSVGVLAGYFGIGGGFLIIPALIYSGGLSIFQSVATSLMSVSSFGLVTASRYLLETSVDIMMVVYFVIGGVVGGFMGLQLAKKIPQQSLMKLFAAILFIVASYVIIKTLFL